MKDPTAGTRRRGAALEEAILAAAWERLADAGYGGFTYEAIAERAHTSKPVLYRRWSSREELLLATLRHHEGREVAGLPDTGNLRDDVVSLLRRSQARRSEILVLLSANLSAFYRESRLSVAAIREALLGERPEPMAQIVRRAIERGEITGARLTPRIVALPFDLYRHAAFMTLEVPEKGIEEIVDEVFMPLVRHLEEGAAGPPHGLEDQGA